MKFFKSDIKLKFKIFVLTITLWTRQQVSKINVEAFNIQSTTIQLWRTVRNPGFIIDDKLSMSGHVTNIVRSCFFSVAPTENCYWLTNTNCCLNQRVRQCDGVRRVEAVQVVPALPSTVQHCKCKLCICQQMHSAYSVVRQERTLWLRQGL